MADVVVYRKRRSVEALLILAAWSIGFGGYLLTHLNTEQQLPQGWPLAAGITLGLALAAHLVVRWRLPWADPMLLPLVVLLNGIGLAMIHRLDLDDTKAPHSAELQLMWTVIAVVVFAVVIYLLKDYRILNAYWGLLTLAGFILLMLPLLPVIGKERNGARIWIEVAGMTAQPAELAKIVLALAFAAYLVGQREVLSRAGRRFAGINLPRPRDLAPILTIWLLSLGVLVFQKDLGAALLVFGLFVTMLYVATGRVLWPVLGGGLFTAGAYLAYLQFGHVQTRVESWLDPFADFDRNYQVIQGQFGLAWGGFLGTGWGLGRPNLTPIAKSDFISAALGEELGLAGLTAIMLVYGIIVSRGLRASLGARDPFGKLLAAGLSFIFALQVVAIIGGVTRLLPLTGLTTPYLSQGGSSLVANWILLAVLMVITHQVRKPTAPAPASPVQSLAEESTQVIDTTSAGEDLPAPPRPAPPDDLTEEVVR